MNYKHLVTIFPAAPLCACLFGLLISRPVGIIAYIAVTAVAPLLASNRRLAAFLDQHYKLALGAAIVGWAVAIFRLGWFCGRCSM